jgi:MFS family permease
MAGPYRELFSIPGTRGFVAAGLLGRMSMSMTGLGIVLMVSAVSGSYATAGAVSATCSLAIAASAPVIGRLADRHGQARVLPPLVLAATASLGALILCGALHAPSGAFFSPPAPTSTPSESGSWGWSSAWPERHSSINPRNMNFLHK